MTEKRCVWYCAKTTNSYNPAHRCLTETDLVKVKGRLLCRHHKNAFAKTGKVGKKP